MSGLLSVLPEVPIQQQSWPRKVSFRLGNDNVEIAEDEV